MDEGDIWKIGQVEDKIPTTGQIVHEGDEREPDGHVKTSSPLNSTDQGLDTILALTGAQEKNSQMTNSLVCEKAQREA